MMFIGFVLGIDIFVSVDLVCVVFFYVCGYLLMRFWSCRMFESRRGVDMLSNIPFTVWVLLLVR